MTRLPPLALLAMLLVSGCSDNGDTAPRLNISADAVTVSGLSSGGYMAAQLHVAFSNVVTGAAVIAAGPYYCAEGALSLALGRCTKGTDMVPVDELLAFTVEAADSGQIDPLENLGDDRVWILHGAEDTAVARSVTDALFAFYGELAAKRNIQYVTDVPAGHGFPTKSHGTQCDRMESPFLNACGFDAAGALLEHLYGPLKQPSDETRPLIRFPQPQGANSLAEWGYAYVPEACEAGRPCRVHVAFHGCRQGAEFVGDAFARHAGYNGWAEANDIVILYPQVAASVFNPLNPHGCWDWWGYTGDGYPTRSGEQPSAIMKVIAAMAGA